ncbi:DUF2637 domain-containing protein [Streptomyces aurantiacus]|uniref:DUF2637 domain-containing protein n=1 Tax=Streptomyces aurantiacus TaxID=47760 RepID=UPI0027D8C8D9|nr:DUF2637 domain-containing protein [Streptomyces aurantiacus]
MHQREFALQGGADATSATLWPLSVDGLLLLATVGLLKPARHVSRWACSTVWMAFFLGIGVSLAANMAAAPTFAWRPILVAGWPPVALLFSVELLASHHRDRETDESAHREPGSEREPIARRGPQDGRDECQEERRETPRKDESDAKGSRPSPVSPPKGETTAEEIMWDYYQEQRAEGRIPTGAELDRVAGTNNYGRAVLKKTGGEVVGSKR